MGVEARRLAEEQALRERHYAQYCFRAKEIVTLPWCGRCGRYDHFGFVESLHLVGVHMTANVYLACQREVVAIGCRLLAHPKELSREMRELLEVRGG